MALDAKGRLASRNQVKKKVGRMTMSLIVHSKTALFKLWSFQLRHMGSLLISPS